MSIEQTLERIAAALEIIAAGKPAPMQTVIPLTAAPVEVKKPVEVEIPVLIPAPVAVAPTVTIAPVIVPAAPVATGCPITSGKELMDYVMSSYKALGAAKGAAIQNVLSSIGCTAINEVRPDQYAALYAGIEALKA